MGKGLWDAFAVRLSPQMRRDLQRDADRNERTVSATIRYAISLYFERNQCPDQPPETRNGSMSGRSD